MRYYDTLSTPNEVCLSNARKLLGWLEVDKPVERTGFFRQVGDECAWWVLHYAEVEARESDNESLGACWTIGTWKRKHQITLCLSHASQQLEAERLRWLAAGEKEEAQLQVDMKVIGIQCESNENQ